MKNQFLSPSSEGRRKVFYKKPCPSATKRREGENGGGPSLRRGGGFRQGRTIGEERKGTGPLRAMKKNRSAAGEEGDRIVMEKKKGERKKTNLILPIQSGEGETGPSRKKEKGTPSVWGSSLSAGKKVTGREGKRGNEDLPRGVTTWRTNGSPKTKGERGEGLLLGALVRKRGSIGGEAIRRGGGGEVSGKKKKGEG